MISRRTFMAGVASALVLPKISGQEKFQTTPRFSVFSKHLQFLDYPDMADAAANIGFDGIDLTVRKGGHVEPEQVAEKLPLAIEAIEKAGLRHDLMASDIRDVDEPLAGLVLRTAALSGIRYYRMGYLAFENEIPAPKRLDHLNERLKKLAELNRELNIAATYQNHAGVRVGSEIWDIWFLLRDISPFEIGCQYDIRHAVVEGGQSWENGLRLIAPQINTLVLKDFVWTQGKFGKWEVKNVPLGQGMVDFVSYFKLLKILQIDVPVCIHYEYNLGGAEHGNKKISGITQAEIFKAMKGDLDLAKKWWMQA